MGTDINFRKHLGRTYGTYIGLPAFDPAASAYFASTGITGATQQQAINNLVKGLKQDGLWSKMKAVYPFVTDKKNLLSYTNAFGNSYYITDGTSSFTPNNTTAPDGTNTATRFLAIASNNNYFYSANTSQGQSFGTGNKTLSIYVKAGTFSGNVLLSITSDGNTQSTVATLTNDWQRITVTKNVIVAGGTPQYYIDLGAASMTSGQFFYIWGAQLEDGTSATTYQPIATTQQAFISNQFKYNLVNPVDSDAAFRLVFNGGWTHSANGATPNGTNGYADTYLIPSTSLTAHNIHLSYYSRTNSAVAASNTMGSASSEYCRLVVRRTSDIAFNIISDATVGLSQYTVTDSRGLFVANAPSINTRKFYQNGVAKTPVSQTTLGTNGLSTNKIVLAANNNGVILEYDNKQTAFASIGDGLLDAEATALYNRVQNFQLALNRAV